MSQAIYIHCSAIRIDCAEQRGVLFQLQKKVRCGLLDSNFPDMFLNVQKRVISLFNGKEQTQRTLQWVRGKHPLRGLCPFPFSVGWQLFWKINNWMKTYLESAMAGAGVRMHFYLTPNQHKKMTQGKIVEWQNGGPFRWQCERGNQKSMAFLPSRCLPHSLMHMYFC